MCGDYSKTVENCNSQKNAPWVKTNVFTQGALIAQKVLGMSQFAKNQSDQTKETKFNGILNQLNSVLEISVLHVA